MPPSFIRPALVIGVLALLLSACGRAELDGLADGGGVGDGPSIVVTTTILGDLVQRVAGDAATVEVLLPVGADPHGFAPSASQATSLRDADLVVVNGLGFEEGLQAVIDGAAEDGVAVFTAADHVAVLDNGIVGGDPHIWFDPLRMAQVVRALGDELDDVDGDAAVDWTERAESVAVELETLDRDIIDLLELVEQRTLVTNHDVLGYFAARYDFTVLDTIIPGGSTLAEPSAADLDEVVESIEQSGVGAVFAESSNPSRLAEVVAEEVGRDVEVVELYTESLSDADGPASSYDAMMRLNAMRIATGLTAAG